MANKKENTEIEKKEEAGLPAEYAGYEQDAGQGFDNQTAEDISVPFLEILQPGSPECQEEGGARPGEIINRATGDTFSGKEGIPFIPSLTQHVVVEWVPRDQGGGIVATHELDSALVKQVRSTQPMGKYTHPENGNDLIETFYVYGVFSPIDGSAPHPAVLAFSSTKIKPYKDWMFKARGIVIALPNGRKITKLPLFSHRYLMKSKFVEKNNYKWHNWDIGFDGENAEAARLSPDSDLYQLGRTLYEDVASGMKKADTDSLADTSVDPRPSRGDTADEEVPY